jgi:hypothetical protein
MTSDEVEEDPPSAGAGPPRCPHCGDEGSSCEHIFGVVREGDELLTIVPEWNEVDDLVSDLQRLTTEGDAILEAMSSRPEAWWLRPRGTGIGVSRRLAGGEAVAARLRLAAIPCDDGAGTAYFAEDVEAARERLRAALGRVKRDLSGILRRLGAI